MTRADGPPRGTLKREVGHVGAVLLGLGSIIGTGVFVSLAIGAQIAGAWVVPALLVAGLLAACNALSSAQLAAAHPVSGGTYEYGHRYLSPSAGFAAGWMFLLAKSASAATAALGFGGYALSLAGVTPTPGLLVGLAVGSVAIITLCVLGGLKRSNAVNALLVGLTLLALASFVGLAITKREGHRVSMGPFPGGPPFLETCALMFVAYTGYGRVATLGEEIRDPRRNIPRAIVATISVTLLVYLSVASAGVLGAGASAFVSGAAPLEDASRAMGSPVVALLVAIGATTAMLGVLLNLVLGLSRVGLAMGRRGDLPGLFAALRGGTPVASVLGVGAVIAGLALIGDVKATWSFSAFTVLVYYAITNACALRLPVGDRLYPRAVSWAGLATCLALAFWVEPRAWIAGTASLAIGFGLRAVVRQARRA